MRVYKNTPYTSVIESIEYDGFYEITMLNGDTLLTRKDKTVLKNGTALILCKLHG